MRRALPILLVFRAIAHAEDAPPLPEPEAKRILTEDGYVFCRDSDVSMPMRFRDWCDVGKNATTCPQIQQMCDRPLDADQKRTKGEDKATPHALPAGAKPEDQQAPSWDFPSLDLSLPGWVEWVFWAFVGIVIGALVILLVWLIAQRRAPKPLPEDKSEAQGIVELIEAETAEVEEFLRLAREAAATDVVRACMLLYAAALKRLEEQGFVRRDRSTTNREYLRQIRGKTPLDSSVRDVVREVERAKFGRSTPTLERFQAMYDALAPGLSRLSIVVLLVLGACRDPDLEGRRAFTKLIEERGVASRRLGKTFDDVDAKSPPILVDSRVLKVDGPTLESIERGFLGGGRYIVLLNAPQKLPGWPDLKVKLLRPHADAPDAGSADAGETDAGTSDAGIPDAGTGDAGAEFIVPAVEDPMEITCAEDSCESLGLDDDAVGRLPAGLVFELPEGMLDEPEILLEAEGHPFAVRFESEQGILVFVADRRLFANGAMAVPGNATLAVALAESLVDRKGLQSMEPGATKESSASEPSGTPSDGTPEGKGDERAMTNASVGFADPPKTPVDSLARSGLLILMLQVLAAAIVAFLSRGIAFGTLRDRRRDRRRSFREHVEALGLQLMHRHGSRLAASMYAGWVLERLRQRLGLRSGIHDIRGLSEQLARRLGEEPTAVRETLEMADAVRREPNGIPLRERDLLLVRRLGVLLSRLQEQAPARA